MGDNMRESIRLMLISLGILIMVFLLALAASASPVPLFVYLGINAVLLAYAILALACTMHSRNWERYFPPVETACLILFPYGMVWMFLYIWRKTR